MSNREAGNGRYDILVKKNDLNSTPPVILELKVADSRRKLEESAGEALGQIGGMKYD